MTVSSLGDAKSLRGGVLLLTPLRAADNEVYALAQGNLVVGGLSAQGKSGSSVTVNTPTTGRIPNGAQVEREIVSDFETSPTVTLSLKRPHFQTATNIVETINRRFGDVATTRDATSVAVVAPRTRRSAWPSSRKLEALLGRRGHRDAEGDLQLAHRHGRDRRGRVGAARPRCRTPGSRW